MRITDSTGNPIPSLEDWGALYTAHEQGLHWKRHRSAYSIAEFLLDHNGGETIRQRASEVFGQEIELQRAIPEYEQRFDQYGRGRVHDLAIFGETESGKRVFIGVEAKVDESFGKALSQEYLKAKARQITGASTRAPERIEQLLGLHFRTPNPAMFDVRYQLLYATAGTLAADADLHLLCILVFETPLYDKRKGAENKRDYLWFMDKVGAETLTTRSGHGHRLKLGDKELACIYESFKLS